MKFALFLGVCLAFAFVVESFGEEKPLEDEQGKESFEEEAVSDDEQGGGSFEEEAVSEDEQGNDKRRWFKRVSVFFVEQSTIKRQALS